MSVNHLATPNLQIDHFPHYSTPETDHRIGGRNTGTVHTQQSRNSDYNITGVCDSDVVSRSLAPRNGRYLTNQ